MTTANSPQPNQPNQPPRPGCGPLAVSFIVMAVLAATLLHPGFGGIVLSSVVIFLVGVPAAIAKGKAKKANPDE